MARAKAIKDEMLSVETSDESKQQVEALKGFGTSPSWCTRFKNRLQLVSRRHTTARSLPENFQKKARDFIDEVKNPITTHQIARRRIINCSQILRDREQLDSDQARFEGGFLAKSIDVAQAIYVYANHRCFGRYYCSPSSVFKFEEMPDGLRGMLSRCEPNGHV